MRLYYSVSLQISSGSAFQCSFQILHHTSGEECEINTEMSSLWVRLVDGDKLSLSTSVLRVPSPAESRFLSVPVTYLTSESLSVPSLWLQTYNMADDPCFDPACVTTEPCPCLLSLMLSRVWLTKYIYISSIPCLLL